MTNQQTPIYNDADFECECCKSVWKVSYTDLAKLRNQHSIPCKSCQCELVITEAELQVINDKFKQSEKLSKIAICFTFPYFIICAIVAFIYGGLLSAIMIAAGFIILMTMRSSLTKEGITHFHLKAIQSISTKPKKPASNKAKPNKKKKAK